jgi:hypothetical protein
MLNLKNSATDKIDLVTSSTADIAVLAVWVDTDSTVTSSSNMIPDRTGTAIVTATTTDIVATPGSSTTRNVKHISLRNKHASSPNDVTVRYNNNGTIYELVKCALLAGEELVYNEGIWFDYDSSGGVYSGGLAFAVQADMESAGSTSLLVNPAVQHFHPGHPKNWGKTTVSGGTPTLQVSYNITSITDSSTSRLTVTIANDFSSANYSCVISVEPSTTTYSATTTNLIPVIRNASLAAGSFVIDVLEIDIGQAADPSSYSWICCGDL